MERSPLKSAGSPVVILVMALAILAYPGADGLSLEEACTKLRTHSSDLSLQGITSNGSALILVLNNQTFTIPQRDEYLNNTNPKMALFDRNLGAEDEIRIVNEGTFSDWTKYSSDTLSNFTLKSFYYINRTDGSPLSVVSVFGASAPNVSGMKVVVQDQETAYPFPDYAFGFVSDTQEGLARSFVLRPLYLKDEQGNNIPQKKLQILMTPAVTGLPESSSQVPSDKWYRLDFDLKKTALTLGPLPSNGQRIVLDPYQSLVTTIPMFGLIYKNKVHLWNTYTGQVLMYDYQDPPTGNGSSVQVTAYPFDQYFACNEDQWNRETKVASFALEESQGGIGAYGIILAILLAAVVVFGGLLFLFKRRGLSMSKLKSNLTTNAKMATDKMSGSLYRAKSAAKSASNKVGSLAGKTVTSANGAITSATLSAKSKAASMLSEGSSAATASSGFPSGGSGSKGGSSTGSAR